LRIKKSKSPSAPLQNRLIEIGARCQFARKGDTIAVWRLDGLKVAKLPSAAMSVLKCLLWLALRDEKNYENRTF